MRQHLDMKDRTVTVNRVELIAKLQSNLAEHTRVYEEAMKGYRAAVATGLGRMVEMARNTREIIHEMDLDKLNLRKLTDIVDCIESPKSYADAYEEAIEFFGWEVADNVELTVPEFRKYVLDKWDWQRNFEAISASYGATIGR